MSSNTVNAIKNKSQQISFGEVLLNGFLSTIKGMLLGFVTILAFVCSPIWNSAERMKKLTHFILFAFMGLILLWVLFWIGQRPVFTINQIQLQSNNDQNLAHINQALVRSKVVNQLTGNFFSIRLDVTRKIFEELSWVRSASVRRVWPNGLIVTIEEQEPVGMWGSNEGAKLINQYGELFTVNLAEAELYKNLVEFSGPMNSNKEVMDLYQQLNEWFIPFQAKVTSLNLSSRYSWTAKLDNGMTFELGRDLDQKDRSQLKTRLNRFFKVWPDAKEKLPNKIEYVDLRYANGFAIRGASKTESKAKELVLGTVVIEEALQDSGRKKVNRLHQETLETASKNNVNDLQKTKMIDGRKSE
jgi:cell division protein FtsQ